MAIKYCCDFCKRDIDRSEGYTLNYLSRANGEQHPMVFNADLCVPCMNRLLAYFDAHGVIGTKAYIKGAA